MALVKRTNLTLAASFAALLAAMASLPGAAEAETNLAGKTLKIVIPYGPGGTYDKYGQSFARNLDRYIPGTPTIIVQHMPGAGGLKAMNWHYNVAPRDGMVMIVPLDNSVVTQLMRPEKVRYDARKMRWLGSSNQTNIVFVVRTDAGINSVQDLAKVKPIGGDSGKAGTGYIMQGLVRGLLGTDYKIVTGYKGSSKTIFAVERGELQMAAYNWLAWSSKVPQWFTGEKPFARPLVQMGVFRDPDLPKSVPMLSDMVTDPAKQKAVNFIKVLGLLGRGLALPPSPPADMLAMLRASYARMNADPAFAEELKKRKLRLIAANGAEIEKIVNEAIDKATPDVVTTARTLIYGADGG